MMDELTGRPVDVLVAGAGPTGLLLGNLLGARGLNVLLVEKRASPPVWSMAIGITPPSLRILREIGLDRALVERGVRVRTAVVHGERGRLGRLEFEALPGDYPFILSVPQSETVRLLEENLAAIPSVRLWRGVEVAGLVQRNHEVEAHLRSDVAGIPSRVSARFLAACDGHRSDIRGFVNMPARRKDYGVSFLMADFDDRTDLGDEAHLFFRARGPAESFPLPGGRRRWIVMTERLMPDAPAGFIEQQVLDRAGHDLARSRRHGQSPFGVRRLLNRRYVAGRVVFCGDAAHVMSPIGGQGMNTGFADAEFLADALAAVCRGRADPGLAFGRYEHFRRRAFRAAAARAARGMWLGTRTGVVASALRDAFIRHVLLGPPLREALPAYFAMLTIPYGTLARVPGGVAPCG